MKSILVGLLFMSSTVLCQPSTGADPLYCIPIEKARLLVSDALRLRVADSLIQVQQSSISLYEADRISLTASYTNLLNLSEQKFQQQKEITADFVRLSESWREEADYYQKRYRKQHRQKTLLTAGVVVLIGLVAVK